MEPCYFELIHGEPSMNLNKWLQPAHRHTIGLLLGMIILSSIWQMFRHQENTFSRTTGEEALFAAEARFWKEYEEANAHRQTRNYRDALQGYQNALLERPGHKDALYYAGNLHLLLREFEEALIPWSRLLELDPDAPRTLLQLGTLYACIDSENPLLDLDRAQHYFNRAFELNREETGAMLMIIKLHLLLGQETEARMWVETLLETQPEHASATFLAGYLHWKVGQNDPATSLFDHAYSLYLRQYGAAHAGEGTTEGGVAMLEKGQFCDPFEHYITTVWQDPDWLPASRRYSDLNERLRQWQSMAHRNNTPGSIQAGSIQVENSK